MKLRFLLIAMIAMFGLSLQAASKVTFAQSSKLASGKWVKISVDQTGVYEIPYETLRAMGFSNPEKVGVYGNGGAQYSYNFLSAGGNKLYNDDLQSVPVYHYNGKLYFYGVGPEEISLKISSIKYASGGYFSRKNNNIYSLEGFYFLNDSQPPLQMQVSKSGGLSSLEEYKYGLGYKSHELDLIQNSSETGRLFLGEKIDVNNPCHTWDLYLPNAIEGAEGAAECYFYCDRDVPGTFTYGFENGDKMDIALVNAASTNFKPRDPALVPMIVPGKDSSFYINLDVNDETVISHLDYWVISYQRTIPDLKDKLGRPVPQDFIAFPKLTRNKAAFFTIPGGASFKAFDVTTPQSPMALDVVPDGADGLAKISYNNNAPQVVIFDPFQTQLQIKTFEAGYTGIKNQDLHDQLRQGADLIIICTPSLKQSAERLADLHRIKEGKRVVVGTTDEIYNEFTSGMPDPMAYRAAVKMAYSSEYGCRNLLLMGPLYADFRGVVNEKNSEEGLIAYQSYVCNQVRGAMNNNDFYGIMTDYLNSEENLESAKVHVGVAVMPLRYPAEADTYIDKVEKYLDRDDFAYTLNTYLNIGGIGDNHTHDQQSIDIATLISSYDNGSTIHTPLVIDAYGFKNAQKKFFSSINDGRLIVNYFGHGGPMTLNRTGDFFYAADVFHMRNTTHPFFAFAGCDITNSDRGQRGLGETMLYSTPYGAIGSFLATRETWSGQNLYLFKIFYKNFYRDTQAGNKPHEFARTIGEIVARTKTESTYENELAYQLMCDPELVFPIVSRPIVLDQESLDAQNGDYMEISGFVPKYNSNEIDSSFSGEVVIRIMEPYKVIRSADLCTMGNSDETKHDLDIVYADSQLSMTAVKVENGRFSAKIFVPSSADEFDGQLGRCHVVAYNPETKIAAGKLFPITYNKMAGESAQDKDNTPPVIELFFYDQESNSLKISVSDNLALGLSANQLQPDFKLSIDGIQFAAATDSHPRNLRDSYAYDKEIPLYDLAMGEHSAKVTVADAAGNTTTSEIIFEYNPTSTKYAIALDSNVVNGYGLFRSIGETPDNADIVILSATGIVVRREAFKNGEFNWDASDMAGNKVAKGLYKAYIIETGSSNSKGHSATIDVPVI